MCDSDQHAQYMAALARIEQQNNLLISGRPAIDQFYSISSTQGMMLDYKNRKHIYIFSSVPITLNLGILGNFTVNASTWTNIDFQQNSEITSTSSTIISVLVRATDDAQFYDGLIGLNGAGTMQDWTRYLTLKGQCYNATTGKLTSPTSGPTAFQIFNPANSGKSILIYSLIVAYNSANMHDMRITAADVSTIVGWTNTPVVPVNNMAGGAASVAVAGASNTQLTGGLLGTSRETTGTQNNLPIETLTNGECIYLPASSTVNGLAIYMTNGAAAAWQITCSYLEF